MYKWLEHYIQINYKNTTILINQEIDLALDIYKKNISAMEKNTFHMDELNSVHAQVGTAIHIVPMCSIYVHMFR